MNTEVSDTFRSNVGGQTSFQSCELNECSADVEEFCMNGGICIFDEENCSSSCTCAVGHSGRRCEISEEQLQETPTVLRKEIGFRAGEFVKSENAISATLMTTSDPRFNVCRESALERTESERTCSRNFVCQYGVCEKTMEETNGWMGWKYDCVCDLGSVGLMCEHRCCLNCGAHGTCAVHNGTEYCSCEHQYKGLSCNIFVPVPVSKLLISICINSRQRS